jgi:hypothetical protein
MTSPIPSTEARDEAVETARWEHFGEMEVPLTGGSSATYSALGLAARIWWESFKVIFLGAFCDRRRLLAGLAAAVVPGCC